MADQQPDPMLQQPDSAPRSKVIPSKRSHASSSRTGQQDHTGVSKKQKETIDLTEDDSPTPPPQPMPPSRLPSPQAHAPQAAPHQFPSAIHQVPHNTGAGSVRSVNTPAWSQAAPSAYINRPQTYYGMQPLAPSINLGAYPQNFGASERDGLTSGYPSYTTADYSTAKQPSTDQHHLQREAARLRQQNQVLTGKLGDMDVLNGKLRDMTVLNDKLREQLKESRVAREDLQTRHQVVVAECNKKVAKSELEKDKVVGQLNTSQNRVNDLQKELWFCREKAEDKKQAYEASKEYCAELQVQVHDQQKELLELQVSKAIESMPDTAVDGGSSDNPAPTTIGESRNFLHKANISVAVFRINNDKSIEQIDSLKYRAGKIRKKAELSKKVEGSMIGSNRITRLKPRTSELLVAADLFGETGSGWTTVNFWTYDQWLNGVEAVYASYQAIGEKTLLKYFPQRPDTYVDGRAAMFFAAQDNSDEMKEVMDRLKRGQLQVSD